MKQVLLFFLGFTLLFAEEENIKLSEALGHLIGKNFKSMEFPIDLEALAKGIEDEAKGISSPLSDEECMEKLSSLEVKAEELKKEKNLLQAEEFLKKHALEKAVVSLAEGKVLFETLKEGTGEEVQPYNLPLVRYEGRFLDGTSFTEGKEETLFSIDEAIFGLKSAVVGMKEGEIRRIYIHPEMGYGEQDPFHPNSLLIFEIEVVEAEGNHLPLEDALISEGLEVIVP